MAPDSNMVRSPWTMTGTLPVGLLLRHSALVRKAGEKSITSTR